jgi:hypothetical protein
MRIREPNHAEEAALRQAAHLFESPAARGKNFWAGFQDFGPGTQRLRLVAELDGSVLGHLQGAFANGSGVVEEFCVSTDDGRTEVSQALLEIFELHCLKMNCETILAQAGIDEQLVKSRGFVFFGSIYLKPLQEAKRHAKPAAKAKTPPKAQPKQQTNRGSRARRTGKPSRRTERRPKHPNSGVR